jgi:type I restriction enzyme, S subunit
MKCVGFRCVGEVSAMKWMSKPIGAFCRTGSGGTPSRQQETRFYGGSIPWVKSGELRESIIFETEETITEAALAESSAKLIPSGALLVAMYGATVGRIAVLGIEAASNQAVCHIVPDQEVADQRYLFYALRQQVPRWLEQRVGGAQPNISQQIIRDTPILLPPIAQQVRIAEILDRADAIRRKRQEAIRLTEELLRSAFLEMFGDPVANPKKWEKAQVGDLLVFLTSGSRGWAQYYTSQGSLFLRIQNVKGGKLLLDDVAYVNPPNSAEARRTSAQEGDVLVSMTADLGRTAVIPKGLKSAYINQHLGLLRLDKKRVSPVYLAIFLDSVGGQIQFQQLNREGVKAGLNFDDIRSLQILLPPLKLQQEYESFFDKQIITIARCKDMCDESNNLFNSLLQRAFRGEL